MDTFTYCKKYKVYKKYGPGSQQIYDSGQTGLKEEGISTLNMKLFFKNGGGAESESNMTKCLHVFILSDG